MRSRGRGSLARTAAQWRWRSCRQGWARSPRAGSTARRRLGGRLSELGHDEPVGLAGVRGEDARTAPVGHDGHSASTELPLRTQHRGDVEHLLNGSGTDDARLVAAGRRPPRPRLKALQCATLPPDSRHLSDRLSPPRWERAPLTCRAIRVNKPGPLSTRGRAGPGRWRGLPPSTRSKSLLDTSALLPDRHERADPKAADSLPPPARRARRRPTGSAGLSALAGERYG